MYTKMYTRHIHFQDFRLCFLTAKQGTMLSVSVENRLALMSCGARAIENVTARLGMLVRMREGCENEMDSMCLG